MRSLVIPCGRAVRRAVVAAPRTALSAASRSFGNAPSRVRPVEVPMENAWRQSEREVSASVVIVFMIIFPLWLFVMSGGEQERKREAIKQWALEQRERHREQRVEDGKSV